MTQEHRGGGQLILSRKVGEKIMIGDNIVVTIAGINGNQVRVGIAAPRDVPVNREEVLARGRK